MEYKNAELIFVCMLVFFFEKVENTEIIEEDGVLILNANNFKEVIETNKFVMVQFYIPKCGYCEILNPDYTKAAQQLKKERSEIRLAKVDVSENRELASLYQVGGYPSLKFFRSGNYIPYDQGERTSNALIQWMKMKSRPSATALTTVDQIEKFIVSNDVVIIGFFVNQKTAETRNYFKACELLDDVREGYKFGITDVSEAFNKYGIKNDSIVLFKQFDEGRNDFNGTNFDVEKITNFIMFNGVPHLIHFDPKLVSRLVLSSRGALYLIASSNSDEFSSIQKIAFEIAKDYKGKIHFVIMDSENEKHRRFFDLFGVSNEDIPTMRFARPWDKRSIPDSDGISEAKIRGFADSILANTATHMTWKKSEEVPVTWDNQAVKVLVGRNFYNAVRSITYSFVQIYDSSNEDCKSLEPLWEKLAEYFEDREDLMIAKIDGIKNDVDNIKTNGFPTIYFYKHTPSNSIRYNGNRTFKDFLSFLERHGIHSNKKEKKKDEL